MVEGEVESWSERERAREREKERERKGGETDGGGEEKTGSPLRDETGPSPLCQTAFSPVDSYG